MLLSHVFFKTQKDALKLFPCFILCMIFGVKYFSSYILLTDQILVSSFFNFFLNLLFLFYSEYKHTNFDHVKLNYSKML